MYLVDTNVISAGAKIGHKGSALVTWMDAHSTLLHLSAVTITEIESGIARLRREGAPRKSADLQDWFETLLHLYADRIFPFDAATARIAGTLSDHARGQGHAPGFADVVIAATARRHRLTILTRNLRHFAPLGVAVLDPFASLPPPEAIPSRPRP